MVKAFALIFVLTMDKQNAINFQLLGGIWILQTLPVHRVQPLHAVVPPVGAARRLGGRHGLRHGRGVERRQPAVPHFGGSLAADPGVGQMGYIAVTAFVLNVVVAVVLTPILRAAKVSGRGRRRRPAGDYFADAGDPRVEPLPELTTDQH